MNSLQVYYRIVRRSVNLTRFRSPRSKYNVRDLSVSRLNMIKNSGIENEIRENIRKETGADTIVELVIGGCSSIDIIVHIANKKYRYHFTSQGILINMKEETENEQPN